MSHRGRPKGQVVADLSLKHLKDHISSLLNIEIQFANNCVGEEAISKSKEFDKLRQIFLILFLTNKTVYSFTTF